MPDDELKDHRRQLEAAINAALTKSPHVLSIIQDIREKGFDVFLIIEATVGFSRRKADVDKPDEFPVTHLKLTTQDEKFLRSLKISPE